MSKGSRQRPTDKSKFDANFDRIFGKPVHVGDTIPVNNERLYGKLKTFWQDADKGKSDASR